MPMQPRTYQLLVGLFAALGSYTYGYDLGVMASVIATKDAKARFNIDDKVPGYNAAGLGLIISLFTAGGFFGAGFAGYVSDWFGRRITISAASAVFILGGILQACANNISTLQAGRFVTGFGVGHLLMVVPIYQAELVHPDIRGRIGGLIQFMLGIGALCSTWIGYGTFKAYESSLSWRIPLGIQCVPAGFLGLLIFMFPESPRWLIDHGRSEEGLNVLAKLHANGDINDPFVRAEYESIQENVLYEHEVGSKSWLQLFKNKANTRRTILAVAIQFSIQMTGVSCIQYYSTRIFTDIGISDSDTLMFQGINSVIALVAQLCCVLFVDRLGRRWVLITGNLVNAVAFIIATAILATNVAPKKASKGEAWVFILATWLYQFSFSSACGPLSWLIPSEIFNTATRARGASLATMMSFAANTLIGQVSPIALNAIAWKYFYLFIICNITNALFFWAFLPETKKIPLESMDALFGETPIFVAGQSKKNRKFVTELEERAMDISEKKNATVHVDEA